jgi:large subunit ribosomal protein L10
MLLLQKDIAIDLTQYRADISRALREGLGLAVEAAYVTKETLPILLGKAERQSKRVAMESGYITVENAGAILGFAEAQATSLLALASQKGFSNS